MGISIPDRAASRASLAVDRFGSVSSAAQRAVPATAILVLIAATVSARSVAAAAATTALLVPAAVIDIRERRIPDTYLVAATVALVVVSATARALGADVALTAIAAGVVAMGGPLLVIHLAVPAAMGFGDVKASAVLGGGLGTLDWRLGLLAVTIAAGTGAVTGLCARASTIAFGPFLVFGAWLAVVGTSAGLTPLAAGAVT